MLTKIFTLISTVKELRALADKIADAYISYRYKKGFDELTDINQKKVVLFSSIKRAKNDEERKVLSSMLHDLYNK